MWCVTLTHCSPMASWHSELSGLSQSLLQWISNFGESNTLVDFDPILAHKCSMANAASNAATFLHAFSISFAFRFGFGILVQKCTVFEYVFWLVYLGLKTSVWDLSITIPKGKSLPKAQRVFPWYFGNKVCFQNPIKTLTQRQRDLDQVLGTKSWASGRCLSGYGSQILIQISLYSHPDFDWISNVGFVPKIPQDIPPVLGKGFTLQDLILKSWTLVFNPKYAGQNTCVRTVHFCTSIFAPKSVGKTDTKYM